MRGPFRHWIVLALLAALLAEGSSWTGLRILERHRGLRYRTFETLIDDQREKMQALVAADGTWYQRIDPELGWVTIPGAVSKLSVVNLAGVRAARDYAPQPPPGVVRIAAFGDSFVHGDEVGTAQAWPTVLERSQPRVEVLNFGVGGYGLDQALLRFSAESAKFHPQVVLVGVIADDVLRGVNVFRPFFTPTTGDALTKPRFLLDGDELRLLPNPLRSAADYRAFLADPVPVLHAIVPYDHYAPPASDAGPLDFLATARLVKLLRASAARPDLGRPATRGGQLDPDAEPGRLALATLREFVARVRAQGAAPLIVFFPDRTELDEHRACRPSTYQLLFDRLAADGLPVIDMMGGFDRLAPGWTTRRIMRRNHYSPYGNRLVAAYLHQELAARGLFDRPAQ